VRSLARRAPVRLALLALLCAGCNAQAAEMRHITLDDEELAQAGMTDKGQWQSAPWSDSLWISLPGRATVELDHELGYAPSIVLVYLSFTKDDREGRARSAFLGAGDVGHILNVTDESVTIENISAGDFYLRVVLR
jgi:hypothetical protein